MGELYMREVGWRLKHSRFVAIPRTCTKHDAWQKKAAGSGAVARLQPKKQPSGTRLVESQEQKDQLCDSFGHVQLGWLLVAFANGNKPWHSQEGVADLGCALEHGAMGNAPGALEQVCGG
eukprot:GGOE01012043.1.p6 GENE.GGOE01012043.1~~GGOE01012043.1.p6  ORF type:complete len:120 (+),score=1.73 GGOE01012043.1:630-989(+)